MPPQRSGHIFEFDISLGAKHAALRGIMYGGHLSGDVLTPYTFQNQKYIIPYDIIKASEWSELHTCIWKEIEGSSTIYKTRFYSDNIDTLCVLLTRVFDVTRVVAAK